MANLNRKITIVLSTAWFMHCAIFFPNHTYAETNLRSTIEHPPVHSDDRTFNEIAYGILEVKMLGDMKLGPDRDGKNFWIPAGEAFSVTGKYWPAIVQTMYVWKKPRVWYKPLDNENPFTIGEAGPGWSLTVNQSDGRPIGYAIELDQHPSRGKSKTNSPKGMRDCQSGE